ncbi:hypothetical protein R1flu_008830 [Riccia fluitans]|uniref:Uncharacterized protein n=1 Tax=Riccia fluitans TaxID=41844 RepID=A0ABD1Z0J0_9MARC
MITRRNLAEQLRDYQLRSQHHWASLSFWSSTSRSDGSTKIRWSIFVCIFLVAAASIFYFFKDIRLSLTLLAFAFTLGACFRAIRASSMYEDQKFKDGLKIHENYRIFAKEVGVGPYQYRRLGHNSSRTVLTNSCYRKVSSDLSL